MSKTQQNQPAKITKGAPTSLNGVAGLGMTDDNTYGTDGEIPGGTPDSNLSDYVFTLESSGGGAYSDPNVYTDKSNVWVTNHTNVASGSTPTFSWAPDVADIDDFYSANEMLIHGNDIYIIYRWGSYNKGVLGRERYWNQYQRDAINPDTGEPFGEWPLRDGNPGGSITDIYDPVTGLAWIFGDEYKTSSNILVKFTNCVVDEVAQDITYDSFEKRILFGVQHLHANARTSDKWVLTERYGTFLSFAGAHSATVVVVDLNKPISEAKIFKYSDIFKNGMGEIPENNTIDGIFSTSPELTFTSNVYSDEVKEENLVAFDDYGNPKAFMTGCDQFTATGSFAYGFGVTYGSAPPAWKNQLTPCEFAKASVDEWIWKDDYEAGRLATNKPSQDISTSYYTDKYKMRMPCIARLNLVTGDVEAVAHLMTDEFAGNDFLFFSYDKYIFALESQWDVLFLYRYDLELGEMTSRVLFTSESGHHSGYFYENPVDLISELNNLSIPKMTFIADNVYSTFSAFFPIFTNSTRYGTPDFPDGRYLRMPTAHAAHTDGEFIYLHFIGNDSVMKLNYSDMSFHSYTDTNVGGSITDDIAQVGDYIFAGNEGTAPYSLGYYHKDNIATDNGQITTMTHGPFGVFHSGFKF